MALPGKTEAGSAGTQPCRGIARRAHRDDDHGRGSHLSRSSQSPIGSIDPDALKIPARRAPSTLTRSAHSPVPAEPGHYSKAKKPEKPIQGTVLDDTGFEIKNLKAFCERLEKMGIVFDRPYQEIPRLKLNIAFLTDPAGAYLELTEGLDKL